MTHDLTDHLAEILLRGALLLPVFLLIALFLRRGSAALLRRFWRLTLVAVLAASALALAPPILELRTTAAAFTSSALVPPGATVPPSVTHVPGSPVASLDQLMGLPSPPVPAEPTTASFSSIAPPDEFRLTAPITFALLWLGGVLVLATRKLAGMIGVSRLRRSADPVDDADWRRDLAMLQESCQVSREVSLRQHLALRSPIVTGLRRPVIILPADHASYSTDDRRAVLLHELAHLRHHDALFRWIAAITRILHWPNPLVWRAERAMHIAEERASDDAVLHGGIAAPQYAELLARLARSGAPLIGDLSVAGESAMAQPSSLLPRVHAILRPKQARRNPGRTTTVTLLASASIIAILAGGSVLVQADPAPGAEVEVATPDSGPGSTPRAVNPIDAKLDSIIFPAINFSATSLTDAIEYIRIKSFELDPNRDHSGLNVIAQIPRLPETLSADYIVHATYLKTIARKITLQAEQLPLRVLLDYLCTVTGTSWRTGDHAVIISFGDEILSKNFHVPSEVMEAELARTVRIEGPQSPFDPNSENGLAQTPAGALEWLQTQGVQFREGCAAFYTRAGGVLNVRNHPDEMEYVERIIDSLNARASRSGLIPAAAERLARLKHDLKNVIIPELDFQNASLRDALEYLRAVARDKAGDPQQPSPLQFFVNVDDMILDAAPEAENAIAITLKLRQVPLGVAVKYVVDQAKLHSVVRPYGIEITPADPNRMHLATFLLSPENMKSIRESIPDQPPHQTATDTLKSIGIPFPDGAGSFWNERTGDLIVRQTVENLSQIETFLEGLETAKN